MNASYARRKRQTQTVYETKGKGKASKRWNSWPSRVPVGLLAGTFVLFVGVPLAALLIHEPPGLLWRAFHRSEVFSALEISLLTTTMSTLFTVLLGLPVAYLLARTRLPGRALLETLVMLPTILPPVVAGVALLLTFGRLGLVGRYLNLLGISLPFTTAAVVMAQIFVTETGRGCSDERRIMEINLTTEFRKDLSHLTWEEVFARQQQRATLLPAWFDGLHVKEGAIS